MNDFFTSKLLEFFPLILDIDSGRVEFIKGSLVCFVCQVTLEIALPSHVDEKELVDYAVADCLFKLLLVCLLPLFLAFSVSMMNQSLKYIASIFAQPYF